MALICIFLMINDVGSMFCCQSILWHVVSDWPGFQVQTGLTCSARITQATMRPMQGQEAGSGLWQEPHFVLNEWVPVVSQSLAGWVGTWARL